RDFAFERFVSQGLSMERRCCAAVQRWPRTTGFPHAPTQISSNSSKIVSDRSVKPPPLAKLRCTDTDAAAVAQFVDGVENVDDIKADFEGSLLCDLDLALQANVECLVGMVLLGVCETPA